MDLAHKQAATYLQSNAQVLLRETPASNLQGQPFEVVDIA